MKLIYKKDLLYIDGMLIDGTTMNTVYIPALVDEVNEVNRLAEMIAFVLENQSAIEAKSDSKPIKFVPITDKTPVITSGLAKPATPLTDEAVVHAKALAEEWLNSQQYDDLDAALAHYRALAKFLAKDYIVIEPDDYNRERFAVNPLEMSEAYVVQVITQHYDPAIKKLVGAIAIGR